MKIAKPDRALVRVDDAAQPRVADPRPPQHGRGSRRPSARPVHVGSSAISAVHCVSASTKTRSKNSSSGATRSLVAQTAVMCGRRMRAVVATSPHYPMPPHGPSAVARARPDLLPVAAAERRARGARRSAARHALALELAHRGQPVGRELAGLDRRGHAAAGLAVVAAVGEAAAGGRRDDVGERVLDARRRRPSAAAAGPGVSISSAPSSSVNSSRWVVAWRPRASFSRTASVRWRSSPEQEVHERALADAGHADEGRRPARLQPRAQRAHAPAVVRGEHDRLRADRRRHARPPRATGRAPGRPSCTRAGPRRRRPARARRSARAGAG